MPSETSNTSALLPPPEEQLLSPSASAEEPITTTTPAAKVSPGDGAFSPSNGVEDNTNKEDHRADAAAAEEDVDAAAEDAGFGPPPAFPNKNSLGKRKRTLMAVSATAGEQGHTTATATSALEDLSSDDEHTGEEGNAAKKHQQSQMIHRIKHAGESGSPPSTEDDNKKYNDAMLLASLSDVDSPKTKKPEEGAVLVGAGATTVLPPRVGASLSAVSSAARPEVIREQHSPKVGGTSSSSTATTPLRSNVNPNPLPGVESVKPFALLPKPGPGFTSSKQSRGGNFVEVHKPGSSSSSAPNSPDGRDPKSAKAKSNERSAREGVYAPSYAQPVAGPYPPGYHPGYPYPPHSHPGYSQYPPGYPYMSYPPHGYPPHAGGPPPPGSMPPQYAHAPPRGAYYPGHPQVPPGQHLQAGAHLHAPTSAASQGVTPERWGQYHSPKPAQDPKQASSGGPEPVHSSTEQQQQHHQAPPPYHPLSSSSSTSPSRKKSHVVPSEDGEPRPGAPEHLQGAYGRPHPPPGYGPPPPGYDSRYGPPPPTARDPYYPGGHPLEYSTVSRDENSPPRTSSSSHHGHPDYSPVANTSPRGHHYDYYHDQQPQAPPSTSHPAYGHPHPPHSTHGGYPPHHPESPPSPYGGHYGRGPPPQAHTPHDPYEPFDYAASSPHHGGSNEAHYHVPATVSHEHNEAHHPPQRGGRASSAYHQFSKGGRSIHSEPIILRKKFSWRNYPELEEYLIANRTDYLRHSALNYTAEQKHFNNKLTEGLLELAAKLNYVFDETCFNFVAVRDRIRCYYKSYVQSSKKRGVVVGFRGAAKQEQAEA